MLKTILTAILTMAATPVFAQALDDNSQEGMEQRLKNADIQAEQDHQHEQIFDQQMQMQQQRQQIQQMQRQIDNQRSQQALGGTNTPPPNSRDEQAAPVPTAPHSKETVTPQSIRASADGGNAFAQLQLGVMYFKGQGVKQDYAEAAKWFHMAADQGNGKSSMMLGFLYLHGQGVQQDYNESMKWYRKAADQGENVPRSLIGSTYPCANCIE